MRKELSMKLLLILVLLNAGIGSLAGQGKGVDKQSERVRDSGASRTPASNGTKTDVGAGRGIDFGKGRTPEVAPIPNPSRIVAKRDAIIKAVQAVMRDRGLVLDENASRLGEGILVGQPYTFIKGAVVSQSELSRYADTESSTVRAWTRGRYTLTVEVQAIDGSSANVSVNAKLEGRTDGATGAEWVSLPSSGLAEEEFLCSLIANLTGVPPGGRSQCV